MKNNFRDNAGFDMSNDVFKDFCTEAWKNEKEKCFYIDRLKTKWR